MDISKMPLRKPLVIYTALLVGGVVIFCLIKGEDVPINISNILQWFGGVVFTAYFTSSSFEAIKGRKIEPEVMNVMSNGKKECSDDGQDSKYEERHEK